MFLSITHNRTGEEYLRRLSPTESLDLRAHCRAWVDRETEGAARPSFSEPGSHIPSGCGEYHAQIRHFKRGCGVCWTSEDFFLDWQE